MHSIPKIPQKVSEMKWHESIFVMSPSVQTSPGQQANVMYGMAVIKSTPSPRVSMVWCTGLLGLTAELPSVTRLLSIQGRSEDVIWRFALDVVFAFCDLLVHSRVRKWVTSQQIGICWLLSGNNWATRKCICIASHYCNSTGFSSARQVLPVWVVSSGNSRGADVKGGFTSGNVTWHYYGYRTLV